MNMSDGHCGEPPRFWVTFFGFPPQSLVDVPGLELASALGFQENKAQNLQETLQRVLDRREEERQSKELLQLYLRAVEKEDSQPALPSQTGRNEKHLVQIAKALPRKDH